MTAETIPIGNREQVGVLITSSISVLIVIVVVGLRIIARKIRNRIDYSDYCILVTAVSRIMYEKTMLSLTHLPAMEYCNTRVLYLIGYVWRFWFHTTQIYQRFGSETATTFFKLSSNK
jgi:hypothetical protein